MEVIYGLLPLMLFLGVAAVGIFFWAARSGQFEDMEGEANRILMDEDLTPENKGSQTDDPEAQEDADQKTES